MTHTIFAAGVMAVLLGSQLLGQAPATTAKPETTKAAALASARDVTPLRLLVTVSRYQGDKKVSSLSYSLSLSAGGPRASFSIGAQVPYATTQLTENVKTPSYSYRNVGVTIIVSNQTMVEPGQYRMDINVDDSTLSSSNQIQGAPTIAGVPIFRTFNSSGTVLLRDGQTTQLATAADPITGETMRVDVTLTVLK